MIDTLTETPIIEIIKQRREVLYNVRDELKTEFFGLDSIIDRIIDSVATWYLLPQAISYPVIVNLWGLTGVGKALTLSSKIKTPDGWTTMGEIKLGDIVSTPDGLCASVSGVFPQGITDVYRVTFEDGRFVDTCGEHLWEASSYQWSKNNKTNACKIISTIEIKKYLENKKHRHLTIPRIEHSILEDVELPIHPYLLGAILGDGGITSRIMRFSSADNEIIEKINFLLRDFDQKLKYVKNYDWITISNGNRKNKLGGILTKLKLIGLTSNTKFIPEIYLEGTSEKQKLELLQGLLDTDGTVGKENKNISFCSTSKKLAEQVQYLIRSIGGKAKISTKTPFFKDKNGDRKYEKLAYNVSIQYKKPHDLFSLQRKIDVIPNKLTQYRNCGLRIKNVVYIGKDETQCIMVDNPTHLYITNDFIVTHNTQLVRSLVKKLQFHNKFVEIQMDGFSIGSGFFQDSVCAILQASAIDEGEPGILLLDEFQRFRTIELDKNGDTKELEVKRFQDVWMLLSDGKFSTDFSLYSKIEQELTSSMYDEDRRNANTTDDKEDEIDVGQSSDEYESGVKRRTKKNKKKTIVIRKYKLSPWEAVDYKKLLKLKEPIAEIMTWDLQKINFLCHEALKSRTSNEIDFSKLLIFVCGNLDEAYRMVGGVEDCDTDADIFHDMTKKISIIDIKAALLERFRKEQIARLGNNHIIYPSLSKKSYQLIIESSAKKYTNKLLDNIGIKFNLTPSVFDEIYNNSVFPTQGTRPVFSSVHQILSSPLVDLAIWAIENNQSEVTIEIDGRTSTIIGKYVISDQREIKKTIPIHLDIRNQRLQNTVDFNTLVAVHEAGHGLVFAVLNNCPPSEIKINLASFKGGQTSYDEDEAVNKTTLVNRIAIALAGRVAEELVFGNENSTTGAVRDLSTATELAARYHKQMGFGDTPAQVRHPGAQEWSVTNFKDYNSRIVNLIEAQKHVAMDIIVKHSELFKIIVDVLLQNRAIHSAEFVELAKPYLPSLNDGGSLAPYRKLWEKFNDTI